MILIKTSDIPNLYYLMGILVYSEATLIYNGNERYGYKHPMLYYIQAAYLSLEVTDIEYRDLELDFYILHKYLYVYLIIK